MATTQHTSTDLQDLATKPEVLVHTGAGNGIRFIVFDLKTHATIGTVACAPQVTRLEPSDGSRPMPLANRPSSNVPSA